MRRFIGEEHQKAYKAKLIWNWGKWTERSPRFYVEINVTLGLNLNQRGEEINFVMIGVGFIYYVCDIRYSTLEDGTGGGNENCLADAISGFNQEILATTSNETLINDSYITNSPFSKIKNIRWVILKGAGDNWELNSNETGTIKLVDVPNNIWHWETFSHSSVDMTGTSPIGVSITYTQGIATPSIHTFYASLSLNFNVTYTSLLSCQGVPLPTIIPPYTKNYTSTSTQWSSTP